MKWIYSLKKETPFITFLRLLGVKYTESFSNKYYNEHPHKYNLYGLSKMLSDYGIENVATRITDKETDISNIETPFIAFTDDFVNVYKVDADSVHYFWNGRKITLTIKEFCQSWTGVILLAEVNNTTIEPDYIENKKKERFELLRNFLLLSSTFIIFLLTYISESLYANCGLTIGLLINFIGVFIGSLLIQKQMHFHSEYTDKICSLFKQGDCNDILESEAAKLYGLIGWSEIGLGYFISNILILFFFPQFVTYLSILNICALPYSFWSVWYQRNNGKQWCPLCLIVQVLLWAIFTVNLFFDFIRMPIFDISEILIVSCIYLMPLLAINIIIPKFSEGRKTEQIVQEINSIKANEDVFLALLKMQPYYEVNISTSTILFGNTDGKILLTVFTNPHCAPCANMHTRIEELLKQNDQICVQYIFSSFNESLDSSNKFLIAAYQYSKLNKTREIYSDWFKKGKFEKQRFFEKYRFDVEDEKVNAEFSKHEAWKLKSRLRVTPTLLVNGYKLPDNYKVEDLRFFSRL